ncbi:hypothetical protein GQ54DRAFT_168215 [Martensiomyces pterosporus]|nr:hypothetical protein GQ54DRAFT_168215 [Martensiomyces pterosporus]
MALRGSCQSTCRRAAHSTRIACFKGDSLVCCLPPFLHKFTPAFVFQFHLAAPAHSHLFFSLKAASMERQGRVCPRRVSLMSCVRIRPSLLVNLRQNSAARAHLLLAGGSSGRRRTTSNEEASENGDDGGILSIWAPLFPSSDQRRRPGLLPPQEGASDSEDDQILNAWRCLEVDRKARRERRRWRRRDARRMAAAAAAAEADEKLQAASGATERERGKKRKERDEHPDAAEEEGADTDNATDPKAKAPGPGENKSPPTVSKKQRASRLPDLPAQSLLIPSLLPKGFLRSDAAAANAAASTPVQVPNPDPPPEEPTQHLADGGSPVFDLGLDLGFGIAKTTTKAPADSGGVGVDYSIMEITSFLEKDVDVYTPSTMAKAPGSAAISALPLGINASSLLGSSTAVQRAAADGEKKNEGLFGDIFGTGF